MNISIVLFIAKKIKLAVFHRMSTVQNLNGHVKSFSSD